MAVPSKLAGPLRPVAGVRVSAIKAGIRYPDRTDLVLFEFAPESVVAAVFTRNLFCAAPVQIARQHLRDSQCRYLLINTGNANAGTGAAGIQDARACCEAIASHVAETLDIPLQSSQVLPFSTGVIGEPLPLKRILDAIPVAFTELNADSWGAAARGIMTTDTRPKAVSRQVMADDGALVTITGIAKGAGMIKPDMATMLAFVATDADIDKALLNQLLKDAVSSSFNRITVDGDTSTNDSCVLIATGRSGCRISEADRVSLEEFREALQAVFELLATELIRDAEGASKFITVEVVNGLNSDECLTVAYAIAESPLVKTALFASDPNWGRILAAIGRAGLSNLEIERVAVSLGNTLLVENGGVADSYSEDAGQAEMDKDEITVHVDLARGSQCETVWTSDLSLDYVRVNADYRS